MTQEALSLETGVHRNYIGGIERGERSPSVEAIIKLAEALDVTLPDLFRRAERLAVG
jgi:transcriptional regulator with XRE-family HTH domain